MLGYFHRIREYHRDIRLYLLYTFLANVSIGVFGLAFNLYLYELNLREDFIGIFNALQTAAIAGTALLMGRMISRVGIWRVVTFGFMSFLIVSLGLSVSTNPALLLVLAVFYGSGMAFVFTQVMPFIVELTRTRQRQEVATIVMSITSLSTTVGSLLGGWTPRLAAWLFGFDFPSVGVFRTALILGIALAAFALIPLFLMSEQRKRATPAHADAHATQAGLPMQTPAQVRRHMIVFVAVGGLMALGSAAVLPFFNVYLSEIGASPGVIGLVFAGAWTVAAVTGLSAPYLSRKLGNQFASSLIRVLPMPIYLLLIPFGVVPIAILAHLMRVSSISISWAMEGSYISEILPGRARYAIFGYRSAAWNIGWAVSSLVFGAVIVSYGYGPSFAAMAVFNIAAMGLYFGYFRNFNPPRVSEEPPTEEAAPLPAVRVLAEADAPESLELEPGTRHPVLVVSDEAAVEGERRVNET